MQPSEATEFNNMSYIESLFLSCNVIGIAAMVSLDMLGALHTTAGKSHSECSLTICSCSDRPMRAGVPQACTVPPTTSQRTSSR